MIAMVGDLVLWRLCTQRFSAVLLQRMRALFACSVRRFWSVFVLLVQYFGFACAVFSLGFHSDLGLLYDH